MSVGATDDQPGDQGEQPIAFGARGGHHCPSLFLDVAGGGGAVSQMLLYADRRYLIRGAALVRSVVQERLTSLMGEEQMKPRFRWHDLE
ncbi:MAG TPA: hypothetical protein VNM90_18220 [Haliangium sp.]|nr:hypothetical protein [Haliangium sp.]